VTSRFLARLLLLALICTALPAAADEGPVLVVLGDSLSAEYGLARGTGWVELLSQRLAQRPAKGTAKYRLVNASISGETSSGGRTRLPALLKQHRPAIVVLQLGANDGLRGLPLASMRDNLTAMVRASRAAGAQVLLVGMQIPPNYGRAYAEQFAVSFSRVATEQKIARVPFLLDGFAENLDYFQADRIHPNAKAQPLMLDTVWPVLEPLLAARRG
jgi:acyl-CoA thioesterase I